MKKMIIVSSVVIGLAAMGVANAQAKPQVENFNDYFTVNLENFTSPGKILNITSTGGVTGSQTQTCTYNNCFFKIHGNGNGNQGTVAVTIGKNARHNCTVKITDGAWVWDPTEVGTPHCVGGYHASKYFSHNTGTMQYSFKVFAPNY